MQPTPMIGADFPFVLYFFALIGIIACVILAIAIIVMLRESRYQQEYAPPVPDDSVIGHIRNARQTLVGARTTFVENLNYADSHLKAATLQFEAQRAAGAEVDRG